MELSLCQKYQITHTQYMHWEPDDQAKALAFFIEESQRCQMCGTASWEWEDNPYAYEPIAQLCKGCYLKDTAQEDSKNLPGTQIVLEPSAAITYEMRAVQLERRKRALRDELAELRRR